MRIKFLIVKILIIFVTSLSFLVIVGCGVQKGGQYSLEERPETIEYGTLGTASIANIDRLAFLNSNTYTYGTSSYDSSGSNDDGFSGTNFLYVDNEDRYVIADIKGTGIVSRIWLLSTGVNAHESYIQIYVDGNTEPIVNMSTAEFVNGTVPPFKKPLTIYNVEGAVRASYVSIPFSESIYICLTKPNGFWQVDYQLVDPNTININSFNGNESTESEQLILNHLTENLTSIQ